jgi:hypothetical protein
MKRRDILKLILASQLPLNRSYAQEQKMNPLKNKPYFTLDINGLGATVMADVNGVNVYDSFDSQGQITTTLPVNHMMSPDDNYINLIVLPDSPGDSMNPNANFEMTLKVSTIANRADSVPIASIKFEGHYGDPDSYIKNSSPSGEFAPANNMQNASGGDVVVEDITHTEVPIYEGAIIYTRKLRIPNTLPRWAFFDSDELPSQFDLNTDEEADALTTELFPEYKRIHNALKKKDLSSIMPLFEERSHEIDAAFYFDQGTTQAKLEFALSEAINNKDFTLVNLEPDMVGPFIEDNKKLISLKRDDSCAIAFNDTVNGGSEIYDIIFRKQNGKWIISR